MENGEASGHSFTFDKEFHDIVIDKPVLRRTLEKFLNNMIDEITLGILFDEHRKAKINGFDLVGDDTPVTPEHHDLIQQQFNCPNCDEVVVSSRFASHLEKCMGLVPRGALRKSARRSASNSSSKERESPAPYTNLASDDDDDDNDAEWKPRKKGSGGRRRERSRSKKRRGGSRKGSDSGDSVDVDGDDDSESTTSSISDFKGEYTNGLSSPTSSVGSSDSEKRKRDSSKSKKNNKNRSYMNSLNG